MLDGHAIHQQFLIGGFGIVEAVEAAANLAIGRALLGIEDADKNVVGGLETVSESVRTRALFAGKAARTGLAVVAVAMKVAVAVGRGEGDRESFHRKKG